GLCLRRSILSFHHQGLCRPAPCCPAPWGALPSSAPQLMLSLRLRAYCLFCSSPTAQPQSSRFRLRRLDTRHSRRDAAARCEGPDYLAPPRPARGHEIVEQLIHRVLVKNAPITIAVQIQLERLQLHAQVRRRVAEGDGAEVGLACHGAKTGELGTHDLNGI